MKSYRFYLVGCFEALRVVLAVCFFALFGMLTFSAHLIFLIILAIGMTFTNGISLLLGRPNVFRNVKATLPPVD